MKTFNYADKTWQVKQDRAGIMRVYSFDSGVCHADYGCTSYDTAIQWFKEEIDEMQGVDLPEHD